MKGSEKSEDIQINTRYSNQSLVTSCRIILVVGFFSWFPMVTTLIDFMRQLDPYYQFNLKVELKKCDRICMCILIFRLPLIQGPWYPRIGGTQIAITLKSDQGLSNGIRDAYVEQYRHVIYRWKALNPSFPLGSGT